MIPRPRLLPLILLALSAGAPLPARSAEEGQKLAAGSGDRALRFVRVYVPADQLADAAQLERVRYVPVAPEEFERLVASARTAGGAHRGLAGAAVVSAHYSARLAGDNLIEGEASLEIVHLSDARVMLPLEPCGLAISGATWEGDEGQIAKLGLDADGKLAVLVDRPGRLRLNWALRGQRDAAGSLGFLWEAPSCPTSRLTLELPSGRVPAAEQGLVFEEDTSDEASRRWNIELGGHARLRIRLLTAADPGKATSSTRVRQSTQYTLSVHGLEVWVRLQLDVFDQPLSRVTLALDPGLQLVKALYRDTPLPCGVVPPVEPGKATRVTLEFPEPIEGADRVVRVQALAPLKIDHRWRLPGMRPESLFWREGEATLSVRSPLVLAEVVPIEGRQRSKVDPLPAPNAGETVRLQYFKPDAAVEIVLTQPEQPLQVDCGTTIDLTGGEITAQVVADLQVAAGERFQIEADVAPDWIIDTVELVPTDEALPENVVADWSEAGEDPTSKLTVWLTKPLNVSSPIRLRIFSRRLESPRTLPIDDLTPLRFRAAARGRRLTWLRAVEPYELKLTGAETLTRVEPETLDARALTWFAQRPGEPLFENDAGATGLRVSLKTRKPSYSAAIRVEVSASEDSLVESYWVRCVPEAVPARVDRLLIQFSQARTAPLRWTFEDEHQGTARRSSPRERVAAAGETWEVRLRRPRSEPFELRATRTAKLSEASAIALASLPEAATQQGAVVVYSGAPPGIQIENRGLKSIPIATLPVDQPFRMRAEYRYDPVRDAAPGSGPALTISRRNAENLPPSAWVWDFQIESRYEASGIARHTATYRLENSGAERFRIRLPAPATLQDVRGIWVGDSRVFSRPAGEDAGRTFDVDLPVGQRFPVVSIEFTTLGAQFAPIDSVVCPLPEVDVPVLTRRWTAWLPPGYEARDPSGRWEILPTPESTWTQRLFGPLGRPANRALFDPLNLRDWSRLVRDEPHRRSAEKKAGKLLRRLGQRVAEHRTGPESGRLDWGTLLADDSLRTLLRDVPTDQTPLELLVDRQALARLGLTPRSPVRFSPHDPSEGLAVALLERNSLTLLLHRDALVLTSAGTATLYNSQLSAARDASLTAAQRRVLCWIAPGPLSDRIHRAASQPSDPTLMPVDLWQQRSIEQPAPWDSSPPAGLEPVDTCGWAARQLGISGKSPVRLAVARQDMMRASRWIALLMLVGLGWWKLLHRPAVLTLLLGSLGLAALLLPDTCATVLSGAVLGTLFVLALPLIHRQPERKKESPAPSDQAPQTFPLRTASETVLILLAAWTLLGLDAPARGQEPAVKPSPPWAPFYGVLIPVDQQQQPTGDNYHVPQDLEEQLRLRAAAATGRPQGWLVGEALYRGVLSWEATAERLVLTELTATFNLEVLSPSPSIRISFGDQGPDLLSQGVLLDGRPIPFELQQGTLVFQAPEPGPHRLDLSLRPNTQTGETNSGFDLAIPRLATSRLDLMIPPDAPDIDVRSAVGSLFWDWEAYPSRLEAVLGPTDRLSVRWQDAPWGSGTGVVVDVEELLWLQVQPGSVVLQARLLVKAVEGRIRELRLAADPQLRLRPVEGAETHVTPGPLQTIRIEFSEPISDQRVVEATFVLAEASGVGNLRVPFLDVLDAHVTKRSLAVSVDPSLEHVEAVSGTLEKMGVPDFEAAWGQAEMHPLVAYNLPPDEPPWSLATRTREPETIVEQTLAISLAPEEAQVSFDAHLLTTEGALQYRLLAPAELEIESVSLLEGGVERAERWRRTPDGTVTIFLAKGVSGELELSVRGHLPTPVRGRLPVPMLQLLGAELRSSQIQLFRNPGVQVEITATGGLVEAAPPVVDQSRATLGRLVTCFEADFSAPQRATVRLSPNQPKVRAEQITSLRCQGESWEAEVEFRLHVDRGLVDEFRLNVPDQWNGPYELDPPGASLETAGSPPSGQLIIRPDSAVTGEYRMTISGPLTPASGDRVRAPEITLEEVDLERHLLILPSESARVPLAWETEGLSETARPDDVEAPSGVSRSSAVYEVGDGPFQAVLRTLRAGRQVHLLDVRLAWQADGTWQGVATFDLEPTGTSHCTLRLPGDSRLVQVAAQGGVATPVPNGTNRWQIALGPDYLPQHVEVVFTGTEPQPDAKGLVQFESPALEGVPVRQTLWTVSGPSCYQLARPEGLDSISPLEHELARLQTLAGLIERTGQPPGGETEALDYWYAQWGRRWLTSLERARRQLAAAAPTGRTRDARTHLRAIQRQAAQAAERLGRREIVAPRADEVPLADHAVDVWRWTLGGAEPILRFVDREGSSSTTLQYRRTQAESLPLRFAGALATAGLALLAALGIRRGVFSAMLCRCPSLLGVVAGLAWWLWLSPSVLGWGIVLASLVASFRSGWKRPRPSGSTVVRLSLPSR